MDLGVGGGFGMIQAHYMHSHLLSGLVPNRRDQYQSPNRSLGTPALRTGLRRGREWLSRFHEDVAFELQVGVGRGKV